jgi:hypothetical protein
MNERINELFYEAEHSVNQVFVWDPTGPEREDVIRERFAELIVKETMQVVANQLPSNQYLDVAHAVIEHYKDNDAT